MVFGIIFACEGRGTVRKKSNRPQRKGMRLLLLLTKGDEARMFLGEPFDTAALAYIVFNSMAVVKMVVDVAQQSIFDNLRKS